MSIHIYIYILGASWLHFLMIKRSTAFVRVYFCLCTLASIWNRSLILCHAVLRQQSATALPLWNNRWISAVQPVSRESGHAGLPVCIWHVCTCPCMKNAGGYDMWFKWTHLTRSVQLPGVHELSRVLSTAAFLRVPKFYIWICHGNICHGNISLFSTPAHKYLDLGKMKIEDLLVCPSTTLSTQLIHKVFFQWIRYFRIIFSTYFPPLFGLQWWK